MKTDNKPASDLSIIIVSWNTAGMLRECLRSVFESLGRSAMSAEVIVVDNASTDGSQQVVAQEFPRARLLCNERNLGFAAANNIALRTARSRHLLLLNSDTIVLGDVLARSVEYLDANPEVGAMGCRVLNTDQSVQRTCSQYPSLLNLVLLTSGLSDLRRPAFLGRYQMTWWQRDDEREVDVVTGCYLLVRRTAMEQVGLLDEAFFFYGEETDWCRRFHEAGWGLRLAPVGQIIHHGSGSSRKLNCRRDLLLTEGLIRLHRKHDGVVAAALAWSILLVFAVTRWLGWAIVSGLARSGRAVERRDHFMGTLQGFLRTWPRERSLLC